MIRATQVVMGGWLWLNFPIQSDSPVDDGSDGTTSRIPSQLALLPINRITHRSHRIASTMSEAQK
jgi:hypothetical protein